MKNKIVIIAISLLATLTSCGDFLEETDQDKIVPKQVEHYAALLLGETESFEAFHYIDFMTDNIGEYKASLESGRRAVKNLYTWKGALQIDSETGKELNNNNAWGKLYRSIVTANYIIEFADGSIGTENEKQYVKAEALFLRAYSYFLLNNLYGIPYNPATADMDLGVILRMDTGIQQEYDRSSVKACYDVILADLHEARKLFIASELSEKTKWHSSLYACDLLLSRTYLYLENWDKTIEYATNVINNVPLSSMTSSTAFINKTNDEVIFTLGPSTVLYPVSLFKNWTVSKDLVESYHNDDARKSTYFQKTEGLTDCYTLRKYDQAFTKMGKFNLRASEAYLNRAEAYANNNEPDKAIADLVSLLRKRFTKISSIPDFSTLNPVSIVLQERNKELCFEECHRWFDLRRMKNRPELEHVYTLTDSKGDEIGKEVYTLFSDDMNYTLPLPLKELEYNPSVRDNERYDKIPK